jgi:signal transduction histidine kinase
MFIFIAASNLAHFPNESTANQTIKSIGSLLRAKAIQTRVKEADATKTAFLSSISHELRTPMHGVMVGLELMNNAARDGQWDDIESILKVTESSGYALRTILNDVLDFGRKSSGDENYAMINLVDAAEHAAVIGSTHYIEADSRASIAVQYDKRSSWRARVPEAMYIR